MNKKGIFLSFMTIFTILILCIVGATIIVNNQDLNEQGKVGLEATSLFKTYDETEKIGLYLEQSIKHSKTYSDQMVRNNGGYLENKCQKTQDNYNIWNTCPSLNPKENFKEQFKIRFKEYLQNYKSTFKIFDEDVTKGKTTREILDQKEITKLLSSKVNNAEFNLDNVNNKLLINLEPIQLHPEQTTRETIYSYTPKFKLDLPDFEIFNKLYLTLSNCNSPEECKTKLEQEFEEIQIKQENTIIKIDHRDIHFAFDTSKPIQNKYNPLTQA